MQKSAPLINIQAPSNYRVMRNLMRLSLTLLLIYGLIEGLALQFGMPHPGQVIAGFRELISTGTLQQDIAVTSVRWSVGWIVGAVLGIAVGLATSQSSAFRFTSEWFLTALRAIPVICLVPLSVRFFGYRETGKYFVVAWAVFFVCWVGVHQAAVQLPDYIRWNAKSLGLTNLRRIFYAVLPSIRKPIYLVLRTALLIGLIVTAVAELTGSLDRSSGLFWTEGLGYRIFRSLDQARDDYLVVSILTFSLLGLGAEQLLGGLWRLGGDAILARRRRLSRFAYSKAASATSFIDQSLPKFGDAPKISVRQLGVCYNGKVAFSNLSLDIASGETIAIVGRSGCGKTSLLRCIGGFFVEDMNVVGSVYFDGKPRDELKVGFIQQDSFVFNTLTVWQNVTISKRFRDASDSDYVEAPKILIRLNLIGVLDQEVSTLSGGERQRVCFATTLLNRSEVVLCDEPFASLDALTRRELQLLYLKVFRDQYKPTVLWVTHDLEEAVIVADRVVSQLGKNPKIVNISKPSDPERIQDWTMSAEFHEQVTNVRSSAGLNA